MSGALAEFVNDFDQRLGMGGRYFGKNAVAEVEDVARTVLGRGEDFQRSATNRGDVGQ